MKAGLMRSRAWWISFGPCAALALWVVCIIWQGQAELGLGRREHASQAVIVSHDPSNHLYRYSFEQGGRRYGGFDHPRGVNLDVGQTAPVYFDPDLPEKSALNDFRDTGRNTLASVAPLAACGLYLLIVPIRLRRRALARKP